MPTHQVEEYYLHISLGRSLNDEAEDEVSEMLSEEGYANFEFQDNRSVLVVDDVPSEHDGDELEEKIKDIVGL